MRVRFALVFLAISLMAQDAGPAKTVEQQLTEAKQENQNLRKLLARYDLEYNACHAMVLQLQVLGNGKKEDGK